MVRAKKNAVLAWTTFLTLALAVPGCKQKIASDDGSSVQTLDNFARKVGTPIRQNHCGPSSATPGDRSRGLIVKEENIIFPAKSGLWADERVHEQLKKEVYGVLSQLPPSLLALFFARDGKIDLSRVPGHPEPVAKICAHALDPQTSRFLENDLMLSCWGLDLNEGTPTIFVDPTSNGDSGFTGVHHSLVRMFGRVLSQILFKYDIELEKADGSALAETNSVGLNKKYVLVPKETPSPNDRAFLENLTNSLWKDVYGKSKVEGIDSFEKLNQWLKESAKNPEFDLSGFQDMYFSGREAERIEYQYFVFAEAFDSYYCSDETRTIMKQKFPESYCQMKFLDRDLNPIVNHGLSEDKHGDFAKMFIASTNSQSGSDIQCSWEKRDPAGSEPSQAKFALGRVEDDYGSGGKVPYPQPSGPYYSGYSPQGSYGTTVIVQQPEQRCTIGCAVGGFFSSIFNGIGTAIGGVVKGAGMILGGAVNLVTYPFRAIFDGVQTSTTTCCVSGGPAYGGYGQGGIYTDGGRYAGGGPYGGGGVYGGTIYGGGNYGRPYPPIPPQGGWNSNYPQPCYPQRMPYTPTSPYQQYYSGQGTGQLGKAGGGFYLGQPGSQYPGQYTNYPECIGGSCGPSPGGPGYPNNGGYPNGSGYPGGYQPGGPYPSIPNQPAYCGSYDQYQGYPVDGNQPVKGYGSLGSNMGSVPTVDYDSTLGDRGDSNYYRTSVDYRNDSSQTDYAYGTAKTPARPTPKKKSSSGIPGCGVIGASTFPWLSAGMWLVLLILLPAAVIGTSRKGQTR